MFKTAGFAVGRALRDAVRFIAQAALGSPNDRHNQVRGEVPDMRGGRRGV
jgi:hypothetical protein